MFVPVCTCYFFMNRSAATSTPSTPTQINKYPKVLHTNVLIEENKIRSYKSIFIITSTTVPVSCREIPVKKRQILDVLTFILISYFKHCFLNSIPINLLCIGNHPHRNQSKECDNDNRRSVQLHSIVEFYSIKHGSVRPIKPEGGVKRKCYSHSTTQMSNTKTIPEVGIHLHNKGVIPMLRNGSATAWHPVKVG